ncbi:toll-like receptor 4 isoform X2 [Liolophura sinensis]
MIEIGEALDRLIKLFLGTDIGFSCTYENLILFDESNSASLSSMDVIKKNSRFKELLTYNLSSVGFTRVPTELINWRSYTHFPKLKYLDLSHNCISDFDFADFDVTDNVSAPETGVIDLRYNNITQLNKKTLDSLFNLKSATVLVQDNPLDCSCESVSHLIRLLKNRSSLGRYEYLRRLQCATPRQISDSRTQVGQLTESRVCPTTPQTDLIILCSALGATVLLLIVASVLLIHYRKELIIITFTRLRIKLSCRKSPPLPMKTYDVFISSCDDDREWVKKNVIDALNNFKGKSFNMCLRENWEYGVPIADMIAKSIDTSVHTLAVISSQSLRDEWRHFEFSLALHQSLQEKRRHLIVLFKEDVSKTDLLSDMRKYVATTPCLHFNKRLYRDRLIYALCHDEKTNPTLSARSSDTSLESDSTFVSL